ncbi:MAG: cyclic nucleotide-binding domain-containing protein [Leptolyngbya sp. SIO4C1]|nr:cyclic nucleotide-binding domain-containing protein [Leptolyngbya sp. SIO4C1]
MTSRVDWLQANTILGGLPEDLVSAIAACLSEETLQENQRLILEETQPETLYILRAGRLESYRSQRTTMARAVSLLPGTVLHLRELLLDQPAEQTVIALSDCTLWRLSGSRLKQLAQDYPALNQELSQLLAEELAQVSAQLLYEQERQQALRAYLVPRVKRGVVGASRYAVRLRQNVREATHIDPDQSGRRPPILIFGEPGLNKDNLAALIHFGSANKRQPLIKVNCETLRAVDLFGRGESKPGLLDWLGEGTLLLNNIQDLDPALEAPILKLLETGSYQAVPREGEASPPPQTSPAWILMIAEKSLPQFAKRSGQQIKVPPLRVRKADIEAIVNYFIQLDCKKRGLPKPELSPEAVRSLQSYDFPGNLRELENLVERAITQSESSTRLTEELFWSANQKPQRFRVNLLNAYPKLRHFLRSPWWPDRINYGVTSWFYAIVVAVLFLGPQTREANFGLNLFWAWWWPIVLIGFPFVGRLWCAVCPFMIYGEITQKLSLAIWPRKLGTWPRQWAERWGGWILYGGFALILLWEELWNLENTAYLSGWLLILITAGAMICSLLFERRFWCRYLCPIGGMNGLFAKLSMVELRAQRGICSATCTTYQCYKGGPAKGEGQETAGCPIYSHPAQLMDNRNCVLCMTCLKACPHRSVELNLRPPGIELWTTPNPTHYEVALLLLLWGAVWLHRLPELTTWLLGGSTVLNSFGGHAIAAILALTLPAVVTLVAHQLIRVLNTRFKPRPFIELAYGYLPAVLCCNLAHYLWLGLNEAGRLVPVSLATFNLPIYHWVWIAHPAVIAFLQGTCLLTGILLSLILTQKIARRPWRELLPQHGVTIALTGLTWYLVV